MNATVHHRPTNTAELIMGWAGVLTKNESNLASTGRCKFRVTASPDLQQLNFIELFKIYFGYQSTASTVPKKSNSGFELS